MVLVRTQHWTYACYGIQVSPALFMEGVEKADPLELYKICLPSPQVVSILHGSRGLRKGSFAHLPSRMCGKPRFNNRCVQGNTTFRAVIHLGTGHNGTQRVSHATLRSHLNQLQFASDPAICLQSNPLPIVCLSNETNHYLVRAVVQRSGFLGRRRKLLFDIPLRASRLIKALDSNRRAVIQ